MQYAATLCSSATVDANDKVGCTVAHTIYHTLSQRGFLDPTQLSYDLILVVNVLLLIQMAGGQPQVTVVTLQQQQQPMQPVIMTQPPPYQRTY